MRTQSPRPRPFAALFGSPSVFVRWALRRAGQRRKLAAFGMTSASVHASRPRQTERTDHALAIA